MTEKKKSDYPYTEKYKDKSDYPNVVQRYWEVFKDRPDLIEELLNKMEEFINLDNKVHEPLPDEFQNIDDNDPRSLLRDDVKNKAAERRDVVEKEITRFLNEEIKSKMPKTEIYKK